MGSDIMGREIPSSHFSPEDFKAFTEHLNAETQLIGQWLKQGHFAYKKRVGYELEAWLVDNNFRPAPINERFLQALDNPLVVPELASFNIELNSPPEYLSGDVFKRMEEGLEKTCRQCRTRARLLGCELVTIGILPSLREADLALEHMSNLSRYRALNEQVLRLRHGRPLRINIKGQEHLRTVHNNVMLEAATTSFQLHLQVPTRNAARYFNAAILLSGPMVAVSSNSPFLFGKDLWEETRIPLFEQSVSVGGHKNSEEGDLKRVSFGTGYIKKSLLECFQENQSHFPVLLPVLFDEPPENLAHLRLHNGTIWRWNRPLIGFNTRGEPHLRIEHRVVPAGPSITDTIANAALFIGMIEALIEKEDPPEKNLPFHLARHNFYAAARQGLDAELYWLDGNRGKASALFTERLLPLARTGLEHLELNQHDIQHYLGIIQQRIATGQTGARWQRRYVAAHGHDMDALTAAYTEWQHRGNPVHDWTV
ncbi:conserved hypothetical protein [Nitrosococcus halophilus Nc 4]|uniref:Glutamate--cysteine ligase GCS2 n=1 Tax=Nitrosococcus halophilus (strain Nc4) TaxID=472759 RepID=D5BVT2_NITHN|nr:glutamate-cysteine ligase family protein [Nitrosococcus halophilus]ADE15511.1 conserved hypothetical protein [Nitrosococcus halophilus Nc 4]